MDRLRWLIRIVRSSLPRPRVRLGTMLALVALLAAVLAFLTNGWRREEREAALRRVVYRADARKRRADEYRQQRRAYLHELAQLRRGGGFGGGAGISDPFPPGYGQMLHRAQIEHATALAEWAETVARDLDWAAMHPSEPLRDEPPRPVLRRLVVPSMRPAAAPDPSKQPPVPVKVGPAVVPRVVKIPK